MVTTTPARKPASAGKTVGSKAPRRKAPAKTAARKAPVRKAVVAPSASAADATVPKTKHQTKKASKPPKPMKPRKEKLVRDSFTMPEGEFKLIAAIKQRAMSFQREVKKSEVLRAGLMALQELSESQLRALLESLPVLKTGRPKKAA